MSKLDFSKIPKYSQLPTKPGAPAHSNWGVFGDDDEVGCFNFLTPEGIIEAAKLIRNGKAFRLDNRIGYAEPPIGGLTEAVYTNATGFTLIDRAACDRGWVHIREFESTSVHHSVRHIVESLEKRAK